MKKQKEKVIEYQKEVLDNLLSGFYEQVTESKGDLSLFIIFKQLREDFEELQEKLKVLEKKQ